MASSDPTFQFKMTLKGFWYYILDIVKDGRTPIFLLGMGFEALGLTIQSALGYPIVPVLDAVISFLLAGIIIWYVRKEERKNDTHVH
jgi:hypothetical protein